ncbi:MAG: radical SAM protein [Ignavibacteriae bacterium]|nr:radical SAM protein [Ignavibacteriota bacterium]
MKFVKTVELGKDYHAVENFCFYAKEEGRLVKNNLMPKETDLDRLGFPDRSIFNFQKVIDSYGGAAPFMLNRGCPYNCSFCSNHALAYTYGSLSNLTRMRSVDSCIAEIKDVDAKYKFDAIHVWDDLFITNRKWLYEFLEKYKKTIKKPFMCTTRSNLCDDELFKQLKEGGCYRVHMSLESGNDFIRNTVMKRNIPRNVVIKSFELAHKYGIEVSASSIIGLPFETEDMIKETINLLGSLKIDSPGVNIFYPYRGTHLRDVCIEYGMSEQRVNYGLRERRESALKLPHINKKRLQYYHDNFEVLVRREEGILPYMKARIKKIAKSVLPQDIQRMLRKAMAKRIAGDRFPSNLQD